MSQLDDKKNPYNFIIDELPSLICCYKKSGEIIFVNKAYCRYFNKTKKELIGYNFLNFIPEEDRAKALNGIKSLDRKNPVRTIEHKVIKPYGEIGWQRWTDKVCFEEGNTLYYVSIGEDITETKKTEKKYILSKKKYKLLFENSPAGILVADLKTMHFVKANFEICKMLDYSRDELLQLSVLDIHPKKDLPHILSEFEAQAKGIKRVAENIPCLKKNGDIFSADIYTKSAEIGGRRCNIGFFVDITERQTLQGKIALSEKRLKKAQSVGKVGSWELDLKTHRLVWSDETLNIFGFNKNSPLSYKLLLEHVHPEDRELVDKVWKDAFKGKPYYIVHRIIVDGVVRWVREITDVEFDENKNPIYAIGTVNDITELKIKSAELEEMEEKIKAIAKSAQDGIIMLDDNGDISFWSNAAERIFGYKKEEVLGVSVHRLLAPVELQDKIRKKFELFKQTGKGPYTGTITEFLVKHKDGHEIPVELSLSSVKIKDQWNAVGIVRDITLRKKQEKEQRDIKRYLFQNQKMEAIGTLAGGIAHDFNNILSGIMGYSELALYEAEENSKIKKYIDNIFKAGERAKGLVRQILIFSRKSGDEDLKPVHVASVLEDTLNLVRASIPSSILIDLSMESDLVILGDPVKIQQIILNLCVNAAQSMESGHGNINISLSDIEGKDMDKPSFVKDKYIKLEISDTGEGIPENIIDSIFEPYFTTKKHDKGTGLGLSVVHGIVKSYKGEIDVESVVGKGSTFSVYLPAMDISGKESIKVASDEEYKGDGEHILFVDDELPIVEIHKELLERFGYKVSVRTNSIEALELIKANPLRFNLVITDMTMPKMNGDVLAKEIKKINPSLPVVLCTDFGGGLYEQYITGSGIDTILYKPVLKNHLLKALRNILK